MFPSIKIHWTKYKCMQEKPDCGKSRQRLDKMKNTEAHLIPQSYSPSLSWNIVNFSIFFARHFKSSPLDTYCTAWSCSPPKWKRLYKHTVRPSMGYSGCNVYACMSLIPAGTLLFWLNLLLRNTILRQLDQIKGHYGKNTKQSDILVIWGKVFS